MKLFFSIFSKRWVIKAACNLRELRAFCHPIEIENDLIDSQMIVWQRHILKTSNRFKSSQKR